MRCEHKTYRPGCKIFFSCPYPSRDIYTFIGSVQHNSLCVISIIKYQIETAPSCHNELFAFLVSMSATTVSCRNIIYVKTSFNGERQFWNRGNGREIRFTVTCGW